MIEGLQKISLKHQCSLVQHNGTYNLGFDTRNLPLSKFKLQRQSKNFSLTITYEFLWGTSPVPSYFAGNMSDKYTARITCHYRLNYKIPEFLIVEHDMIRKWFYGTNLYVKCRNTSFKHFLTNHPCIKSIYGLTANMAELSPVIACRFSNNRATVDINYQSFETALDILDNAIAFCIDLANYQTKQQ